MIVRPTLDQPFGGGPLGPTGILHIILFDPDVTNISLYSVRFISVHA